MSSPENPVQTLQRSLRDLMRQNARAGRVVVAVDGLDAHRTRAFANGFAAVLGEDGTPVERASVGDSEPDVRERIVAPFRAGEGDAVLVVDGRFLHAPERRGLWNYSVWLESNPPIGSPRPELPDAEKRYLATARPKAAASAIVENSDPAHPVQVFGDFC
ncbi:MAG: putative GTPase [Microbacterium sp.]|jgi:hypothetical protein|uniref:hypothetical protein n=1 Tax=Microbacterium sp. Kw_RZR3 TaxID=3032903 RepID=UPI0023DAAC81|nr:hypothetical protein [Microbacterium sp. Kw_RZR3]MDF2046869.1 hypothetical protein [Microbacterium sp. Kw_RZR3]MDF2920216.1 putative GTPase [Microbacterium sp.]